MINYILLYLLIGVLWAWCSEYIHIKYFDYNDIEYFDKNEIQITKEEWEFKYGPVENHYSPKWSLSFRIFYILLWPINIITFILTFFNNPTPPQNGTAA